MWGKMKEHDYSPTARNLKWQSWELFSYTLKNYGKH